VKYEEFSEKQAITNPAIESHELCPRPLSIHKFPKRYIVAIMAFFGFCKFYIL
jgi:hypothetical protein